MVGPCKKNDGSTNWRPIRIFAHTEVNRSKSACR